MNYHGMTDLQRVLVCGVCNDSMRLPSILITKTTLRRHIDYCIFQLLVVSFKVDSIQEIV